MGYGRFGRHDNCRLEFEHRHSIRRSRALGAFSRGYDHDEVTSIVVGSSSEVMFTDPSSRCVLHPRLDFAICSSSEIEAWILYLERGEGGSGKSIRK